MFTAIVFKAEFTRLKLIACAIYQAIALKYLINLINLLICFLILKQDLARQENLR
jgi:hypothetical protein